MGTYIGFGALALVIGIVLFLGSRRKKALRQLASTINFSFSGEFTDEDDELLKSLSHLALFRQTRSQGAWSVMTRAEEGLSVTIMEHRISSGNSGKPSSVSEQTVIVFQSDLLRLPTFTLRRQDLGANISTALGYRDFNFETHPTFSKQFHLHGSDEDAIRRVFTDEVLTYYENHTDLVTDGSGDSLMICRLGKTVAVKNIEAFLEQGYEIFSLFKER